HQICLISESDLESFDWNVKEEEEDSDEETEGTGVEFEVLKSQEEKEDFIHYPGFKSTFHQAFATVKKVREKSKINRNYKTIYSDSELHGIIEGHTLLIERKMPMDNLERLIKLGFAELEEELLNPLNDALTAERSALEERKTNERNII
ncbi:1835_t:CDS:2, partial [Racocetra fulgida]